MVELGALSDEDIRQLTTTRWRVTASASGQNVDDHQADSHYLDTSCKWNSAQCRTSCKNYGMSNCKTGDGPYQNHGFRVYCCGSYYSWIWITGGTSGINLLMDAGRFGPDSSLNSMPLIFVH